MYQPFPDNPYKRFNLLRRLSQGLHLDWPLFFGLALLSSLGLVVLYSAGDQNISLMQRQIIRMGLAFSVLLGFAQIHPRLFQYWSPWLFGLGVILLIAVLVIGDIGKGAQRWINLGFIRFQPSEIMKLAVPMMVAWYLAKKPLPPKPREIIITALLILVPMFLIFKQPDLGTSLLVASSGGFALFLAGLSWRIIFSLLAMIAAAAPILWQQLHSYQQERILNLFFPERDPLGTGYHIIQSTIAIGSGGLYGKGWTQGTQSHLSFLPERSTDFIFAVYAEEFGLIGILLLLSIYLFIIFRGLYIATRAQDSYGRLLAGSISLTFFVYLFVNMGMVSGILPVVGVPLPLISYGGTSMVTLMAGFGLIMSIHTHKKLIATE